MQYVGVVKMSRSDFSTISMMSFFLFEKRTERFILDTAAATGAEVIQISRKKEFVNLILTEIF